MCSYISDKNLIEECDTVEETVVIAGDATTSCLKEVVKTFYPMSCVHSVNTLHHFHFV